MPYDLRNRNVLVTAGSRGLGALVAENFAREGCNVAINYLANTEAARATVERIAKVDQGMVALIQGDAGVQADCVRMVRESVEKLGGLDIIVSNAGWTKLSRFDDLDGNSEEDWDKCFAVNVKGHMFLLREALATFNANPDGGVFLVTSSVAAVALSGSSMPYSVTKSAGLHLVKCLAATQGPKVRVNAVLPGLLLTDWGDKFGPEKIAATKAKAVLKKETELRDCAAAFVSIAQNASMTGQGVQVDSGLFVGMM
ncbi:MAG: hypothetical protein M1832_002981 [Thelocarpon impressellum]|nr:MAG: hypothetical protein M1832_002981 [Thelocarpon impressellum]